MDIAYTDSIVTNIFYWITTLGSATVITILGIFVGIWFILKKDWLSAAIMIIATGSTSLSILFLKNFFNITRPETALQIMVNDPSFPSGHAGMAAAFFIVLAYLLAPKISSKVKKGLFITLCILLIILIGISRLILNVHWTIDVIAGWSIGMLIAAISILLIRYINASLIKKKSNTYV